MGSEPCPSGSQGSEGSEGPEGLGSEASANAPVSNLSMSRQSNNGHSLSMRQSGDEFDVSQASALLGASQRLEIDRLRRAAAASRSVEDNQGGGGQDGAAGQGGGPGSMTPRRSRPKSWSSPGALHAARRTQAALLQSPMLAANPPFETAFAEAGGKKSALAGGLTAQVAGGSAAPEARGGGQAGGLPPARCRESPPPPPPQQQQQQQQQEAGSLETFTASGLERTPSLGPSNGVSPLPPLLGESLAADSEAAGEAAAAAPSPVFSSPFRHIRGGRGPPAALSPIAAPPSAARSVGALEQVLERWDDARIPSRRWGWR